MKPLADSLIQKLNIFFQKAGKKQAIIGISGGVDSAVTASIAVRALGKRNILGIRMPHADFSSAENLSDAEEVCNLLDIPSQEIEISSLCAPCFSLPFVKKDMTKGNIMARMRMILLYALANEHNGLVLGTGNKTEISTGFFTKYGDGGVDIEVLGSVWKTEVVALAQYLELPEQIYTKPPTAELFLGHTDEEEMGISYANLDVCLKRREQNPNMTPETPEERRAFELFLNSRHKRGEVPVL